MIFPLRIRHKSINQVYMLRLINHVGGVVCLSSIIRIHPQILYKLEEKFNIKIKDTCRISGTFPIKMPPIIVSVPDPLRDYPKSNYLCRYQNSHTETSASDIMARTGNHQCNDRFEYECGHRNVCQGLLLTLNHIETLSKCAVLFSFLITSIHSSNRQSQGTVHVNANGALSLPLSPSYHREPVCDFRHYSETA